MFDVISFGTATLDVFLRSPEMEIETDEPEKEICVRYGAKLEVNEIYFEIGGGGTNTAVTFQRQGLKAGCVVQIGDDFAGEKVITDLKKDQVDLSLIDIEKGIYTDFSTILWASDGGRTILVYRGQTRLEVKNVPWDKLEAPWFYISSLEGNLEIVSKLISSFPQAKIAWNPGRRELQQKEALLSLLPGITQFNVNKEEMMELLGTGAGGIEEILKKAQELPCQYVVITDDRKGSYLWDKKTASWLHAGIFEEAQRYETTGAGDAFGSGLVTGLIKGYSLEDCLRLGTANASSKVTKVGAKKGLLTEADLPNWPKEKLKIEKIFP